MSFHADAGRLEPFRGIATRRQLLAAGVPADTIAAQLAALNWRVIGPGIVLHYGPLTRAQRLRAALIGHGPGTVLTSFTSLTSLGLPGWDHDELHVLAPPGTAPFQHPELPPIVLHSDSVIDRSPRMLAERAGSSAVRAAGSLSDPRQACALLAAVVKHGLVTPRRLARDVARLSPQLAPRARRELHWAAGDIDMGEQAFNGLDPVPVSRLAGLPDPYLQSVRPDSLGRRRYLDVRWATAGGDTLQVEIDAALQLIPQRWWRGSPRLSAARSADTTMLRIPSAIVRHEPAAVADGLHRIYRQIRQVDREAG